MHRTVHITARLLVVVAALAPVLVLAIVPAPLAPVRPAAGEVVVDIPTTVTLVVAPGPETAIGTALTLTAVVARDPGPPVDAGAVVFHDGGEPVAVVTVDGSGTAVATYTPPTVGAHVLVARYLGSPPEHDPAQSTPVTHTVTGDPPAVPAVGLTVAPADRAPHGTPLALTAEVALPAPAPGLTGTVVFRDLAVEVARADVVVEGGVARARATVALPPGVHHLSARFLGDLPEVGPASSPGAPTSVLPATCPDQAWPGVRALLRLGYLAVLHRCPDPDGFAYWSARLAGGTATGPFGRGLALSAEGIATTVDNAYAQVLGRPADPAGRAVWGAKLRSGWTTSQLWAALAASPEFVAGAGAGSDPVGTLVDRAYTRLVRRPADAASVAYWRQRLTAGATRWGALRALVLTSEALGHIVDDAHRAVLGTAATPGAQDTDQTVIKARRGDWRLLAAELLAQPRAADHAQTYPDPAAG